MIQGERSSSTAPRRRWVLWLKVAGTFAVFGVLFYLTPVDDVWSIMTSIDPILWFGVFLAHVAGHLLAAAKWRGLIGGRITYLTAVRAHFAGLAANLALPGVAGGDVIRAGLVVRTGLSKSDLVLGSLIDRLIDTATLLAIAAVGAAMIGAASHTGSNWTYIAAGLVTVAGVAGVFLMGPVGGVLSRRTGPGRIVKLFRLLGDALQRMGQRKLAIVACIFASLAIQAGFASLNTTLSAGVGGPDSIAMWLFAWPLAKLIATLPISIGGLGVRELSLSALFAPFGVAAAPVIAASLLWQSIVIAAGALGALGSIWRAASSPSHRT